MPVTSMGKTDMAPVGIVAGVLVLTAAFFPLAQELDDLTARKGPMYEDRDSMEWLQYQSVQTTGQSVAVELRSGESARIAGEVFTPSEGVTVDVRTPEADSYCVQVSNQYGDVSQWACLDEENPPRDPDARNTGP